MTSLNKICNHWTAGNYKPCKLDLDSYHYLIDDNGHIYFGTHKPEDNINCYDGCYAKHCGGGNTGCIGVAFAAMVGFTENTKYSKCPITPKQLEAMCCLNAYLSIQYRFEINEKSVFTHYEFDQKREKSKREGKIDIVYIPFLPNLSKERIGGYIRQKSCWYRDKIKQGKYKFTKKGNYYEFIRND